MFWLIQLLLPLALLLWLAFRPARHQLTRLIQIVSTAAILLALHLAGLWIVLPWWVPWLYWGLFAVALWRGRRVPARSVMAAADYAQITVWAGVIGFGGWVSGQALAARTPPSGEIAVLAMPMKAGRYYVANGGARAISSAHLRTMPRATQGQRNYWGQSHGVDIIAIDRWGLMSSETTLVLAPCAGRVVRAQDGAADGRPVDLASPTARAGNYALIRCGSFDILLAHFRNGSLRVTSGDLVRAGQPVGTLGNSGASDMPHLHIHAQRPGPVGAPFSGKPVPMRIGGHYLVRGDRP
jgi:murein DD-endopeptidase MepM/ murein hydrolase activator NlpD